MKRSGSNSRTQVKRARLSVAAVVLGAAVMLATALVIGERTAYASTADYLPNVTLINQNSASVSLASLRGKPVLVGFIHTMCKGPCEMMTTKMRSVASALRPAPASDVTMLLITTDPADDQPPQLLQYAKSQGLSGRGWVLVTGSHDNITRVMRIYGVKHEDTDDAMMHVMKLFLIAPNGTIVHTYPGMKASPQSIASDIRTMSRRNPGLGSERVSAVH